MKPNDMSYEDAVQELTSLNGLRIGEIDGKPEIILTHKFAQALELARYTLNMPERQETGRDVLKEWSVTLNGQCHSCGYPVSTEDNFCSNCGRKFRVQSN